MKTIQVYDPPMCCSTGIYGTDVDPDLVSFAAMLAQLANHGVLIERYNLGKEPLAFVKNPAVKALLESDGKLRPCRLRHCPDRSHTASHEPGQGVGPVPRRQHQRQLMPRAARRVGQTACDL